MIKLEKYDYSNVSLEASKEIAVLYNDSFREDFLNTEFWPAKYNLSDLPAKLVGPQLLEFSKFRVAVDQFAWRTYLSLRNNPSHALLLFRDLELNAEPVGLALYRLPEYYKVHSPSLLFRCKTWVMSVIFKLRNWWNFGTFDNIFQPAEMMAELKLGDKMCNAALSEERIELLNSLSRDALYKECYPKPMSISIGLFGIRSDQQGRGLGKKLMDMTLEHIREHVPIVEPPFNGPAKLQLSASPVGINFYKKYGFTLAAEHPSIMKSGKVLTHSFFYLNLT